MLQHPAQLNRTNAIIAGEIRPVRKPGQLRVGVLQVSGISLMTVGTLNATFLPHIGWHVNVLLGLAGIGLLWASFRWWNMLNRKPRARRQNPALAIQYAR